MVKIYYDKAKHREIEDISGKKTLAQIKKEFGDANYKVLEIDRTKGEAHTTRNGKLEKYSLIKEKQQIEVEREAELKLSKDKFKSKFNFTDEDFEDLRKIMR